MNAFGNCSCKRKVQVFHEKGDSNEWLSTLVFVDNKISLQEFKSVCSEVQFEMNLYIY